MCCVSWCELGHKGKKCQESSQSLILSFTRVGFLDRGNNDSSASSDTCFTGEEMVFEQEINGVLT